MARIRESRRERTLPTPNSLSTDSTTDFKTALTAGLLVMASLWAMVRFVIVLEEEREEEIEEKGEEGEREKGGRDRGRGRGRGWGWGEIGGNSQQKKLFMFAGELCRGGGQRRRQERTAERGQVAVTCCNCCLPNRISRLSLGPGLHRTTASLHTPPPHHHVCI